MDKKSEMDAYFLKGFNSFNEKKYYDAHEHWEYLWTNYYFKDRLLVQGLIQVSVGYFHITNLNLKGAKGLFNKCLPKLEKYQYSNERIRNLVDLITVVKKAKKCVEEIESPQNFNWDFTIILEQK